MPSLDQFTKVRSDMLASIATLPADQTDAVICGHWTIKQVIAHVASWDAFFTQMLQHHKRGDHVPQRDADLDAFNEKLVQQRAAFSWTEICEDLTQSGQRFLDEYSHVEPALWQRKFWNDKPATPAWIAQHNTDHYTEHLAQINSHLTNADNT